MRVRVAGVGVIRGAAYLRVLTPCTAWGRLLPNVGLSRRGVRKSIRGQLETLQGQGSTRFSKIQLGDCGDTCQIKADADPFHDHAIGLAVFRSPEANPRLRWKSPTDIWFFGATGGNLHIFNPKDMKLEDANYKDMAFLKQLCVFGPVPLKLSRDRRRFATNPLYQGQSIGEAIRAHSRSRAVRARQKIPAKTMKLDPRDRSTAEDLLQDEWFEEEQVIIIMDAILFALKPIIAFLNSIL